MRLLSVVVTSYNKVNYIERCIESVLRQSYRPIEILVVDNGSQDGTRDIISKYAEKYNYIIPIFMTENKGVSNARNTGIGTASGSYLCCLDGDDIYYNENKLSEEMKIISSRDAGEKYTVAFSRLVAIDEDNRYLFAFRGGHNFTGNRMVTDFIASRNIVFPRDYCFPKSLSELVGGYNVNMNRYEDLEFLMRLSKHSEFISTNMNGTGYRINTPASLSQQTVVNQPDTLKILRKRYFDELPLSDRIIVRMKRIYFSFQNVLLRAMHLFAKFVNLIFGFKIAYKIYFR